jgi:hypothetical protein
LRAIRSSFRPSFLEFGKADTNLGGTPTTGNESVNSAAIRERSHNFCSHSLMQFMINHLNFKARIFEILVNWS